MQTTHKAVVNFKKLAEMFPNAVTETIDENGETVRAIDKDVLMREINTKLVDGNEERYQFTWPDKKKSVLLVNAPINKTLRPCREESVDFVYKDDFAQSTEEYLANSGQFDEEGNRLVRNLDSNGRFHTDWLNMMYPRLRLRRVFSL